MRERSAGDQIMEEVGEVRTSQSIRKGRAALIISQRKRALNWVARLLGCYVKRWR